MCRGVIYRGKFARSQGELAKLLGDGDWKRGKKLIVFTKIDGEDDDKFQFTHCLCGVNMQAVAEAVNCIADDGESHSDDYLLTPKDHAISP